jgi:hypothetical protein
MPEYRAYMIGIDGHRFIKAAQFLSDHPDDATALKAAEQIVDRHDVELWDCARLVARIDHTSRANAICDDIAKAYVSATDSVISSVGGGLVEKTADLKVVETSDAAEPFSSHLSDARVSPYKRPSTGWRGSRKAVSAVVKLFRRYGG